MSLREILRRTILRRRDSDIEAELQFHLDMETEAGLKRGLPLGEARRAARLRAGFLDSGMEEARDQRTYPWLSGSLSDLRHAWAGLRRQPGFLAVAGGALTLAVAANTLIFTVANGVLFRPLPYKDPERLIRIYEWSQNKPKFPVSILNYIEDKQQSTTLESIALYSREDLQFMHGEAAERLTAVQITEDFFPTLGIQPSLGRNFLASEMKLNTKVVILSHTMWRTRFNSDRAIVGKTIRLNRDSWTIVGVMPAGFQHVGGEYRSPLQGDTVDIWHPLGLNINPNAQRYWHFTNAVARVKPGVPVAAVTQDLNRVMDDLTKRYPDAYMGRRARVELLPAEVVGKSRTTVQLVMAAGLLVLIVACVNVAGLCVARVLARRRELAIRYALGAGRWRLIRAVLAENLLLGIIGGVAGILLAAALVPLIRALLPGNFPRLHEIRFDFAAAGFAVASALGVSLMAGLVPALRQTGHVPREGLGESTRMTAPGSGVRSLRGALVVTEIALACVLCFGTALLMRSALMLQARDHGFEPRGAITFQLQIPRFVYSKPEKIAGFYDEHSATLAGDTGCTGRGYGRQSSLDRVR